MPKRLGIEELPSLGSPSYLLEIPKKLPWISSPSADCQHQGILALGNRRATRPGTVTFSFWPLALDRTKSCSMKCLFVA